MIFSVAALAMASTLLVKRPFGESVAIHAFLGFAVSASTVAAILLFGRLRGRDFVIGSADVAIIVASGFLLGPFLFGLWLGAAVALAASMHALLRFREGQGSGRGEGKEDRSGEIPMCPALLVSLLPFHFLVLGLSF